MSCDQHLIPKISSTGCAVGFFLRVKYVVQERLGNTGLNINVHALNMNRIIL